MVSSRPLLTIIAGPNGSGKSTLTEELQRKGVDLGTYINADEIETSLGGGPGEERSKRAQEEAERLRQDCLQRGVSFTFETVMSHASKVALLAQARVAGFDVVMYFVALEDPSINIERVKQRVALGGHPVPEDRISARYHRCLALLPSALAQCDRAVLFDNSYRSLEGGPVTFRPFCEVLIERDESDRSTVTFHSVKGGPVTASDAVPKWAQSILPPAAYEQRKRSVRSVRSVNLRSGRGRPVRPRGKS